MKLSKQAVDHLKTHIEYPVSKADLLSACDNWSDVPEADKKAALSLPNKAFGNVNEILRALSV